MIVAVSLTIWLYLLFLHGYFWHSSPELQPAVPLEFPDVDIIVPARDESHTIRAVINSLRRQDYGGRFRLILVDDDSSDGTSELASDGIELEVITLRDKPAGWSGKLWALSRGIAASSAPMLLFTDADIVHGPKHLSTLVAKMLASRTLLVSEMVQLNCVSLAERALVPAFVYFFQMLYPFSRVNNPQSRMAAAAGGTVLIRREALDRIGGIESIKSSLIDDVALAAAVKSIGPIFLAHSVLATSIRPYPSFGDVWKMISRTAFTQLRYSASLLLLTVVGLCAVWLLPVAAVLLGHSESFAMGLAACCLAGGSYLPTLARYRQNRLWCVALPLIVLFYTAATMNSAFQHWFGRGTDWKNRAYVSRN